MKKGVINTLAAVGVALLATGGILVLVLLTSGGEGRSPGYHSPTLFVMDTTLELTIQGRSDEEARGDTDAAVAYVKALESSTSRFKPGSDVSLINEKAGAEPVVVHPETLDMVERSIEFSRATGGAFDITVAPVVELWGFYDQEYRVPSQDEIDRAVAHVDYRKILVDRSASTIMLAEKGMEIDLGGVAKGYAVAGMFELLKQRGVKSGLINFGGTVGAIGMRIDGGPWVVGVRNPRGQPGELIAELKVADSFVASSGDYERYFVEGGTRYCHIFDPRTGKQATGTMSTTVVGPDATGDDILSTALFVLGTREGLDLLGGMKGYCAMFVDGSGKIETSTGMREYIVTIEERI